MFVFVSGPTSTQGLLLAMLGGLYATLGISEVQSNHLPCTMSKVNGSSLSLERLGSLLCFWNILHV